VAQARRNRRRSLAVLCAMCVASLLASAPAFAASQREHAFSFAFGRHGAGDGQFSHPSGVAVNDTTGNVYVADGESGRVEEFEPVLNSEHQPEREIFVAKFGVPRPTFVAVDNCVHGGEPCSKEEDPSVGDVYVIGARSSKAQDFLLYKFNAEGVPIGSPINFKVLLEGVAVDTQGTVFVYDANGQIIKFSDAETNEKLSSVQSGTVGGAEPGLAVDSEGGLYVGSQLVSQDAGADGALEKVFKELESEYRDLHESSPALPVIARLNAGTGAVTTPELDYEPTTAVAVNPGSVSGVEERNEVYALNVGEVAGEQVTTVAAFGPESEATKKQPVEDRTGELIQRFGASELREGDAIAVDPNTGAVYVADGASNDVDVFELEPRGAPVVVGVSASPLMEHVTKLSAQIRPSGQATSYVFEYGTGSCTPAPSQCAKTPPAPAVEGFGQQEVSVEVPGLAPGAYNYRVLATNASGTVASAEQTFLILVSASGLPDGREWEMVSPPNKDGAEVEALTRGGGGIVEASAGGAAITYIADGPIPAGSVVEGSRNPEPAQILSTRGPQGRWTSQDITTPNTTGAGAGAGGPGDYQLFSPNLALALAVPFPAAKGPLASPPLSPPLSEQEAGNQQNSIYLRDDRPLAPEPAQTAIYEKAQANGKAMTPENAGYLPLVTELNEPGPNFGNEENKPPVQHLLPSGASPDLSHVVFQSTLVAPGLYEWGGSGSEHKLQLVSQLPGNKPLEPGESAILGGDAGEDSNAKTGVDTRDAVSEDGSLVFWTSVGEHEVEHLYVRDMELEETLPIDVVPPGEHPEQVKNEPAEAVYQTASESGSRVFFTDTQRLTTTSKAVAGSPDLYVYEVIRGDGVISGRLTDLTPQEGANVPAGSNGGAVLGASTDGSYIYFMANGALAPNASPGHCAHLGGEQIRPAGTTCNLYVSHYHGEAWEAPKLIASLSSEDSPDWNNAEGLGDPRNMTSRVSPNGHFLAFMSDRSLTGYDNEDRSVEEARAKGEAVTEKRLDEEVFLYKAIQGSESLTCVSCNPSGAQPRGVLDIKGASEGEGIGLVVDRAQTWTPEIVGTDHWLSGSIPGWTPMDLERAFYQSRYLSNEGRLFFNSADALVPLEKETRHEKVNGKQQEVGVENVYEYQPNEVGSCHGTGGCVALVSSGTSEHESAFLDASESGGDVFFLTAAQLSKRDADTNFDVYDAHVCGVEGKCPEKEAEAKEPCQETDTCRSSGPEPPPTFTAPLTSTFSGPGNFIQQVGVLPVKEGAKPTPKPLTRAQKLAKALKTCRTKDKKNKGKRIACEKQARKKYGKKPAKKSAHKGSVTGAGK